MLFLKMKRLGYRESGRSWSILLHVPLGTDLEDLKFQNWFEIGGSKPVTSVNYDKAKPLWMKRSASTVAYFSLNVNGLSYRQ